jgi:hypothetical protein
MSTQTDPKPISLAGSIAVVGRKTPNTARLFNPEPGTAAKSGGPRPERKGRRGWLRVKQCFSL